jgi:hypothetical protein
VEIFKLRKNKKFVISHKLKSNDVSSKHDLRIIYINYKHYENYQLLSRSRQKTGMDFPFDDETKGQELRRMANYFLFNV